MSETLPGLEIELGLDSSGVTDGVNKVEESLEHLEAIAASIQLEKYFDKFKESVGEFTKAFDENAAAARKVAAVVSDMADVTKFNELAESLSKVSNFSKAVTLDTVGMLAKWNLSDKAIADMLPGLENYASKMGEDLPSAAQRFGLAISSGEASQRRLGLAFDASEKAAFKAASTNERAAMIATKLANVHGVAADTMETAAGASTHYSQQQEELFSKIGELINAPVSEFWNAMTTAVDSVTNALDSLSPAAQDVLGWTGTIVGGLAGAAIGVGALAKGWLAFKAVLSGLQSLLSGTVSVVWTMLAPLLAVTAAAVGMAAAYGAIKNAMEGQYNGNPWELVVAGLKRSTDDFKTMLTDVGVLSDKTKEKVGEGSGDFSNKEQHKSSVDMFADMGKYTSTQGDFNIGSQNTALNTGADFSELQNGATSQQGNFQLDGSNTNKAELDKQVSKWIDAMTDSNNALIDANMSLEESVVKDADKRAERAQAAGNAPGGVFTQALAGYNVNNTDQQNQDAMANTSTGTQIAGGVISGVAGSAGSAGKAAAGAADLMTGNIGGAAQNAVAILSQSKSFQTIMNMVSQTINTLVQAINPILNVIIPALSVVLGIVSSVVKEIIGILTPIMAPIMKLITTIMLVVQPFITIGMEIAAVMMKMDPVMSLLNIALSALSKGLMWLAGVIVNDIMNPIIKAWDAIIDAIDSVLSWAGVDLSSLKMNTVALNTNVDAVDSVTNSLNALDSSTQDIPQGFKVALAAYNNGSMAGTEAPPSTPATTATTAATTAISAAQITTAIGALASTPGMNAGGWIVTPAGYNNKMVAPTSTSNNSVTSNNNGQQLTITGPVTVQAPTSDIVQTMFQALKNKAYTSSGTNMMGATSKTQYGF